MEIEIEKYAKLKRKNWKRHKTDGMELPNQEKIERLEERTPMLGGKDT